jgi:UDP-N-acetylglucosamine transferase subunit ALG13
VRTDRPFLFVTVGTDHHPFDRLIVWVDRWAASNRGTGVRLLVQSGTARPPRTVQWAAFMPHDDTMAALGRAMAVVSHAGPGTVMSCRSIGLLPIVVPRTAALGEHVDDHQVSFARQMALRSQVRLAESYSELATLLDRAVEEPAAFRTPPPEQHAGEAIARFDELVEHLIRDGRGPSSRRMQEMSLRSANRPP